jgi:hypothetical protein
VTGPILAAAILKLPAPVKELDLGVAAADPDVRDDHFHAPVPADAEARFRCPGHSLNAATQSTEGDVIGHGDR